MPTISGSDVRAPNAAICLLDHQLKVTRWTIEEALETVTESAGGLRDRCRGFNRQAREDIGARKNASCSSQYLSVSPCLRGASAPNISIGI